MRSQEANTLTTLARAAAASGVRLSPAPRRIALHMNDRRRITVVAAMISK
jgi:hypothetical protein